MPRATHILLGRIGALHGLQGEVRLRVPQSLGEAFATLDRVTLSREGEEPRTLRIRASRPHGDVFLVKFEGIDDRQGAEMLRGCEARAAREDLKRAGATEPFPDDLEGLRVETSDGRPLGVLEEALEYPAGMLYRVRDGEKEHLIPDGPGFIVSIDLDDDRMVIEPPPGLLELNE